MTQLFPDISRLLVYGLQDLAGGVSHTGTATPSNLEAVLPFVRVLRTGGGSTRLNAHPVVEIDVFGALYTDAELLAERIRDFLTGPPPGIAQIDRAICDVLPRELPWGDGSPRRFQAIYSFTLRRRRNA